MRYKPVDLRHPCLPKGWKPTAYEKIFHAVHSSRRFPVYWVKIITTLPGEGKFRLEVSEMWSVEEGWLLNCWAPWGLAKEMAQMLSDLGAK